MVFTNQLLDAAEFRFQKVGTEVVEFATNLEDLKWCGIAELYQPGLGDFVKRQEAEYLAETLIWHPENVSLIGHLVLIDIYRIYS